MKKINNCGGQYGLPGLPGMPFPPLYNQVPPIPPYDATSRAESFPIHSSSQSYYGSSTKDIDSNTPLSLVVKKKKPKASPNLISSSAGATLGLPEPIASTGPMPKYPGSHSSARGSPEKNGYPMNGHYPDTSPPAGFDLRLPRDSYPARSHHDSTSSISSTYTNPSVDPALSEPPRPRHDYPLEPISPHKGRSSETIPHRLTTLRSLLSEPPKASQDGSEACDLSCPKAQVVAPVSSEAYGRPAPLPTPVEEVHCPSDASVCDSPAHSAYDIQKPNTKEALKIVLTKKTKQRRNRHKPEPSLPRAQGPEATQPAWPTSDAESSPSKQPKADGSPRGANVCPICYRSFDYRSSFRRHMRIHEGVYSHQCAVCGRKFTRKEHFDRHKCSRRPNKPSRSADGNESSPEKRIKVAYPPVSAMEGLPGNGQQPLPQQTQPTENGFESSHAMLEDSMYFVKDDHERASSPAVRDISSAAEDSNDETRSLGGESRRKKSIPRKAVSQQDEEDLEAFYRTHTPRSSPNDRSDEEPPSSPLPIDTEVRQALDGRALSSLALETSSKLTSKSEIPDRLREYIEMSPSHSVSEDESLSDPGTPTDEFTLETGSYKVSEEAMLDGTIETNSRGKFIKVTKQGKYLKLKNEVQVIDGHLCFVCPNCRKVFHRSSNFSRHMRIHRGVYSYLCPTCHRGFFRKEHFQKHKCHRKSMSFIWERKTKLDMVLKPKRSTEDEEEDEEEEEETPAAPPAAAEEEDMEEEEGSNCLYIDENPCPEPVSASAPTP